MLNTCAGLFSILASTIAFGVFDTAVSPLQPFTISAAKCPRKPAPKCVPSPKRSGLYISDCLIPETEELARITPDGIEYLVPNGKDRLLWAALKYVAHAPIDPCTGKMVKP